LPVSCLPVRMNNRRVRFALFLSSAIACLAISILLAYRQLILYRSAMETLPPGSTIAGLPVGGLTPSQAGQRLVQAYTLTPVEIQINSNDAVHAEPSRIHIDPLSAGQRLDIQRMLEQVAKEQSKTSSLDGFWNYLWNHPPGPMDIPLSCSVDEETLAQYLEKELLIRYEQMPSRAQPVPGDVIYVPGKAGQVINIDQAISSIEQALCSLSPRTVEVFLQTTEALPPDPSLLQPVIDALIQGSGFDGVIELYFQDLQRGDQFTTAFNKGQIIRPGIAFTAASTIKIPVMVSIYHRLDGIMPDGLRQQMEQMIDLSDNSSTDEVMQQVLDVNLGPLQVTEDMQALGLQNTFLAGYFYQGAPLLQLFTTPANQRADISTDPDIYNQTSAADMGFLLADIQQCASDGSGPIITTFSSRVSQGECQEMIDLLSKNKKGVLLEAGLPEGVHIARKYGWVTDPADGLMHSASDAALVFTPGGNFVLTAYLYHPDQLQWDPAQRLVARLATAVNNYFNQWK